MYKSFYRDWPQEIAFRCILSILIKTFIDFKKILWPFGRLLGMWQRQKICGHKTFGEKKFGGGDLVQALVFKHLASKHQIKNNRLSNTLH